MTNYPWGLDSYTQYIKTWDFDEKADKNEVYTKSEVDAIIQKLKDDNHLV